MVARGLRQDQKPSARPAAIKGTPAKRSVPMGSLGTLWRRSNEMSAEGTVRSQRRGESRRGRFRRSSIGKDYRRVGSQELGVRNLELGTGARFELGGGQRA